MSGYVGLFVVGSEFNEVVRGAVEDGAEYFPVLERNGKDFSGNHAAGKIM